MFAQHIEQFIVTIGAAWLTEIVVGLLLLLFGLAAHWKRTNQHHAFTQYAPTLLTTLGILGTFCGIVAGLLGFDVNQIDASIGALLAGMKTAFTTSLAGMALALLYKVLTTTGLLSTSQENVIDEDQVGVAELYQMMMEQRDGIHGLNETMKLIRADANDHRKLAQQEFEAFQDRLWRNLQEFADVLSKSATETVIEALKQVIVDFNRNLTEQFGENFKQLNEAVFKLVEWQERYKDQIGQMVEQYALGVSAIDQTETAVSEITAHTQRIPESMDTLRTVLDSNQHQIQELDRHLNAFAEVRDRAVEAVPQLREQIDTTLQGVSQASVEISAGMKEAGATLQSAIVGGAEEFVASSSRVNGALQESSDVIVKNSEEVKIQFNDLVEGLNNQFRDMLQTLERIAERQSEEAQKVFNGLRKQIEEALSDTGDVVQKQVGMLDTALERELSHVMTEMGRALGQISGQFTSDYQRLVEQMRHITRA